ncbi:alpha/beta hydrolase [Paenibacillus arenosi]|uniref:Alpha/beta hydrolase n=1 Tax=Paenibacillus arenosi TaxID=2774142 RepID=A0ABR9B435_9BACL|nr:alpha/beta hydrolase [Paenibacillus arenosi]MBD8499941.1 alpha/beta hydrolase [Paenibacillus arenosi]
MQHHTFTLQAHDGLALHISQWSPDENEPVRAVVQIAHGMTETGSRYERFARSLTEHGYIVYANDHRGHGQTSISNELLGHLEANDMRHMVQDMDLLSRHIESAHPQLPLLLFGHSMGSFLSTDYLTEYGQRLKGAVLSGSNGPRGPELGAGVVLAKLIGKIRGRTYHSNLINNMAFGGFNRRFQPSITSFDWLSRDKDEVRKYVEDPYCGFICSVGFYEEMFHMLRRIHQPKQLARIPNDLPILLIAGDMDPVSHFGKGVPRLEQLLKQAGSQSLKRITYKEGRHELLNDTNRDEVTADVIQWFDQILA